MHHRTVVQRSAVAVVVATSVLAGSPATAASTLAVTSLSATSGPLVGGERISVHGNGFDHLTKVLFGGAKGLSVRVTSTHALSVIVPKHKAGRVDIRVLTTTGESPAVKADRFTYVSPPVVTTLTGTTRVTVKGKNFTHVKAVLFGKTKGLNVHVVSTTTLLVTAPTHTPGTVDLHVQTAYGTSKTVKTDHFTYPAPVVGQPITPPPTLPPTTPPAAPTALVVGQTALPDATQATAYAGATFAASGGTPPYTWSAHDLPVGLTLSPVGGLSGTTYASAGPKALQVTVSDAAGKAATRSFSLHVTARPGWLWGWGANASYTLGDGNNDDHNTPVGISGGLVAVSECSEEAAGFMVKANGGVYGWGLNTLGQVGDGSTAPVLTPTLVLGGKQVVSVACAMDTVYALTADGSVYTWGIGTTGETGLGDTLDVGTPLAIPSLTGVVALAAGNHHALALRGDGTVLTWGTNADGELGVGRTDLAMSATPLVVPGLNDVVGVAAGGYFSFVLHRDGTVSGWGPDNPYVYLGDGDNSDNHGKDAPVSIPGLSDIVQLATTGSASFAVRDDGTLWSWGIGSVGELGQGTSLSSKTPTEIPLAETGVVAAVGTSDVNVFAVTSTGDALAWGFGVSLGQPSVGYVDVPTAAPWLNQALTVGQGRTDGFMIRLRAQEEDAR